MKNNFVHIRKIVQQQLEETIDRPREKYFLLAVSGGPDSVLLAHVFHALELKFCLAHVHYGLRGKDSDADALFVKELGRTLNVKCFVRKADPKKLKAKGASLQMLAREMRYAFFDKVAQKEKTDLVVLGHHANDQVETVLLNFFRGCGIDGLRGMKTLDEKKFRPLLTVQKEEIVAALAEKKLSFRTDQSNFEDDYKRNFLRNTILPALEKKWPGVQKTLLKNSSRMDSAAKALAGKTNTSFGFDQDFVLKTEVLEDPLQLDGFRKQAVQAGFDPAGLEKLLKNKSAETKKLQGRRGLLEKKAGTLRFMLPAPAEDKIELKIKGNQVSLRIPDQSFLRSVHEEIDARSVQGTLTLRAWQAGDKMMPLGMKGFKKISDLLTDLKLPASLKAKVYVLCDEEKIVWLVGFRIDERVKLKEQKSKDVRLFLSIR